MSLEDDTYSTIFTALKHPIRRRILRILNQTPTTYTDILTQLGIDNGLLNYHLDNMKDLITKGEGGKYSLSEFGRAAVNVTEKVEAPAKDKTNWLGVKPMIGVLLILAIAIASLSAFSIYQLDQLNKQGNLLSQKILELNTTTAKLQSLSSIVDLTNKIKPATAFSSGTQIFSSYVMTWNYEKLTDLISHDSGKSPVLIYIPVDGASVHFELIAEPAESYDLRLTMQRGIAWSNDTWVRQGTVNEVFNTTNPVIGSEDVYMAPIVWSLKTHENGALETPALGKGWYTIHLFGPIRYLSSGHSVGSQSMIGLSTTLTKYRVYLTVDVLKNGIPILIAATSDFPPF